MKKSEFMKIRYLTTTLVEDGRSWPRSSRWDLAILRALPQNSLGRLAAMLRTRSVKVILNKEV